MALDTPQQLSDLFASLVQAAARSVVRVGRRRGSSSGFAWSEDGLLLTAAHGLDDDEVELGLPDGGEARAEVVGRDPSTDLALLRARGLALPVPSLHDEPPPPGAFALAVTRPGRSPRASLGIVARAGGEFRTAMGGAVDRWLELDLGAHPGFSGGLAVDASGRAFGLASAGLARGTPLAVPLSTLRRVAGALLAHGRVRRGYLGLSSFPVRLPARIAGAVGQRGALLVSAVEDVSPADAAGLLVGDLLLALDGQPVEDVSELLPLLEEERIGKALAARVARGGELRDVQVTVGVRPAREGRRP